MRETQLRSLGREDPLEKEIATHSSTLAWKIPWMEERDRLQPMGSQRFRHGGATSISMEIEPHAAIAVDLQHPLREFRVEPLRKSTSPNKELSDTELTPLCPQQFQRNF